MSVVTLDDDEQRAMDDLLAAYHRILGWGLRGNAAELASAVHVIQGFIVQRMLSRVAPESWSVWYQVLEEEVLSDGTRVVKKVRVLKSEGES